MNKDVFVVLRNILIFGSVLISLFLGSIVVDIGKNGIKNYDPFLFGTMVVGISFLIFTLVCWVVVKNTIKSEFSKNRKKINNFNRIHITTEELMEEEAALQTKDTKEIWVLSENLSNVTYNEKNEGFEEKLKLNFEKGISYTYFLPKEKSVENKDFQSQERYLVDLFQGANHSFNNTFLQIVRVSSKHVFDYLTASHIIIFNPKGHQPHDGKAYQQVQIDIFGNKGKRSSDPWIQLDIKTRDRWVQNMEDLLRGADVQDVKLITPESFSNHQTQKT